MYSTCIIIIIIIIESSYHLIIHICLVFYHSESSLELRLLYFSSISIFFLFFFFQVPTYDARNGLEMQRKRGGGVQRATTQVQGWLERAKDAALPIPSIECNGNTPTMVSRLVYPTSLQTRG